MNNCTLNFSVMEGVCFLVGDGLIVSLEDGVLTA